LSYFLYSIIVYFVLLVRFQFHYTNYVTANHKNKTLYYTSGFNIWMFFPKILLLHYKSVIIQISRLPIPAYTGYTPLQNYCDCSCSRVLFYTYVYDKDEWNKEISFDFSNLLLCLVWLQKYNKYNIYIIIYNTYSVYYTHKRVRSRCCIYLTAGYFCSQKSFIATAYDKTWYYLSSPSSCHVLIWITR